jgi:hypothetical protein
MSHHLISVLYQHKQIFMLSCYIDGKKNKRDIRRLKVIKNKIVYIPGDYSYLPQIINDLSYIRSKYF